MKILIRSIILSACLWFSTTGFSAPAGISIICQYATAGLTETGTGTWTALTTNPATTTIASPNSNTTFVTGFNIPGSYGYVWSTAGTTDTFLVLVTAKPNAGPDQTLCQYFSTHMAATGQGSWSTGTGNPATTTIQYVDSATTLVSGFTSPGTYTYYWTNNGCSDTVLINVTAKPNAGPDQIVACYNTGTATMAAVGTGTWSIMANNPGNSVISAPTNPGTTISGFSAPGTYYYIWTANGCTDTAKVTAQSVANDNCPQATSLGTLPAPASCGGATSGIKNGTAVTLTSQSNECASAEAPFPYQVACPIALSSPPRDVWYSFVASATRATISISGATFSNPVIDIWGGVCGSLTGVGCTTGSGGAASVTVYQLTVGSTYYIQVSGEDSAQAGTFTLTAQASTDCAGCLVTSYITSSPAPVNGAYYPGETVTFCYTVSDYYQNGDNWLHGVTVAFGSGWDTSTFSVVSLPPSCSMDGGHWAWYNGPIGDSSVATGNLYGAGFYYETTSGSVVSTNPHPPGDNYGDDNTHNCSWTFCISITSSSVNCLAGDNLSVSFSTTGDGESGSWTSFACNNDPVVTQSSVGACCPPLMTTTGASCNHNDGTATASPTGTNGPWKFQWSNGVVQNNVNGPSTITGLVVGLYTVTVTDIFDCVATASDSVHAATKPNGGGTKYVSCPLMGDSAIMDAVGTGNWFALANPAPTTIVSPDSANTAITGFTTPATYYYVWAIGNCYDTVPVIVTTKPNAGPDQNICTGTTAHMGAVGTGVWSALSTNPAPLTFADSLFDSTAVTGFNAGGAYTLVWTTSAGCSDTIVVNVPFFTISMSAATTTVCQFSNTTIEVMPTTAAYAPFQITWLDSNAVSSPHSDTTSINSLDTTSYFHVQVTDAAGCVLRDSILITTTAQQGTDILASANPLSVCPGSATQLVVVANPNSCGLATSPCTAAGTTVDVGTSTSVQNGAPFQYPSPYGNYYNSAHHQFLIHASELLAQVPSGGQIKSLAFDVGTLYPSTVDAFTISLACVPNDSLYGNTFIDLGGLTQVFFAPSYSPVLGWNTHTFPTAYNWDGRSNLLVDVCFTDTNGGNTNPKMVYSVTTFKSVWCVFDNTRGGECGVQGGQTGGLSNASLFQRPNMQLDMCITSLTGANLAWTPGSGPDAPVPNNLDTVTAHPTSTTDYTVALTNSDGCVSYSYVTVDVDTNTRLSLNDDTFLCSPAPVLLHAAVTGGVNLATVTYTWTASTGAAPPSGTGPAFDTATVNPNGVTKYTVTISSPAGCTITDSMTVTLGNGLPVNKTVDSITCAGTNNGKIVIDMNAGVPPFTYVWTPASGNVDSITNLGPGTYMVLVTDSTGCAGRDTTTLVAPSPLVLTLDSTNILCNGNTTGTVTATVTGGRAPYQYTWNPPSGSGSSLTGLAANTYSLTVTDTSGCTVTGSVQVTQPPLLVSSAASTNLSGAGTNDGTITLTTTGGTPGYTYSSVPAVTGLPNATNLDTGTYIITVCDTNNCCVKDTAVITGPPPIFITFAVVNNLCAGLCNGSATATGSGGIPPYTYSWVDVTTGNTPVGTTAAISNLCAGTYKVTLTDSSGQQVSKDTTITAPPALSVTIDSTAITCFNAANGSLNAIPAGGTPTYTIVWNPGGNVNPLTGQGPGMYIVQVTDQNGCPASDTAYLGQPAQLVATLISSDSVTCFGGTNGYANVAATGGTPPYIWTWSGGSSTDSFASNLAAGIHNITVTDSKGCTGSTSVTIGQPSQIVISAVNTTAAHCATSNDGSAVAVVSGGSPAYTYTWDSNPPTATDSVNGLSPGTHNLVVTDSKNCTQSQSFTIGTQYTVSVAMSADSVTCNGGSNGIAIAIASNGTLPYTYTWSPVTSTTDSVSGLSAGAEQVTVTDLYGCSATGSVQVAQPGPITDQAYFTDPLCTGQSNGKVWVTAGNTTGPYTYVFNGGSYTLTDTVDNLAAGTYSFTITDGKGCTKTDAVTLTDPSQLSVQPPAVTGISCANDANGIISVTASGATPPYTYLWSPGGFTGSLEDSLGPATYTITVTDANGCSVTVSAQLIAPTPIVFTYIESDSTTCPDSSNGHIVVNVVGGTPGNNIPYEYSVNGGTYQENHNFYNLKAGVYTVAVMDSPGCVLDTNITVNQPLPVTAAINPQDSLIQAGTSLQLITTLNNPQGESINSFYWTPSSGLNCMDCQDPVATPYNNIQYTLVVNYGKNCFTYTTDNILVTSGDSTYIPNAFTPNGDGINDYFEVFGTQLESVGMKIFNRWGEKVFDSDGNQWAEWDGTYKGAAQPTGVYVYVVELVYLDGNRVTREGSLTLIR